MRSVLGIGVALLAGCAGSPAPGTTDDDKLVEVNVPDQTKVLTLDEVYAAYSVDPASAQKQRDYFYAFPSNYASLKKAFGFEEVGEDSVVFGGCYEYGDEMIGAFFHLDSVPKEGIAAKAISIAYKGVWQEDGVGYFQLFLTKDLEGSPEIYLSLLDAHGTAGHVGFWKFFLDGPEPYPAKDGARLRALLAKEPRHLGIVDSLLALPHKPH